MTEETRKQISDLNEKHFLQFGTTPSGALRIQWMRTDEMYALFKRDHDEQRTESGVWVAVSQYQKRTMDEFYGLAWTVAAWMAPVSRGKWMAEFGTETPWPREGLYFPIEIIMRAIHMPPDEAVTLTAIGAIRRHLNSTLEEKVETAEAPSISAQQDMRREWIDFAKECQTAFNNDPGGKGSVSFPATAIN